LAPIVRLPQRRFERQSARIPASLRRAGAVIGGVTVDASDAGCGLLAGAAPMPGPSQLMLHRGERRRVIVPATPVWIDAFAPQAVRLGMAFAPLSPEQHQALADLAFWEARGEVIHLHGVVDETTPWDHLVRAVYDLVRMDLEDVVIASPAAWRRFLEQVPPRVELSLERVSLAAGNVLRGRPDLVARCEIMSFFVAFDCRDCDCDAAALVERGRLPHTPECPACGRPMQLR
jgi:hypothetical protein